MFELDRALLVVVWQIWVLFLFLSEICPIHRPQEAGTIRILHLWIPDNLLAFQCRNSFAPTMDQFTLTIALGDFEPASHNIGILRVRPKPEVCNDKLLESSHFPFFDWNPGTQVMPHFGQVGGK
jgi:hypothetical protein